MPTIHEVVKHYPEVSGIHPACEAVPGMNAEDMVALVTSVTEHGLRHEISLTPDGLLVDGRHRLIACYEASVEPRFVVTVADPWEVAHAENIARRHLTVGQLAVFGLAWKEHEAAAARERMKERKGNQPGASKESLPYLDNGQARDKAAERVGVSGRSVDKAAAIKRDAPDLLEQVMSGDMTLEAASKEAATRRKSRHEMATLTPMPDTKGVVAPNKAEMVTIITPSGQATRIAKPQKVTFNQTNDSVDWASWTWNPVTGCEHGCRFCYAREIANSERMKPYYPNGFEPTFHAYRLEAPANTAKPKTQDDRDGRVFVCSMADLFGKWVPDAWIEEVFEACLRSPHWEYLFLTKWPARYADMPLIPRAWYGASVIQQSDVKRVTAAMKKAGDAVTRWVSLEPMLEPIKFGELEWCDLVVIGSQTSTNQPEGFVPAFAPDFDWVFDVVAQCRAAGVPYYLKANLGLVQPGMQLPKMSPRGR